MACHNLSYYLANRSQRVHETSTSFVLRTLASTNDISKLKWLPIKEQFQLFYLKAAHKAIQSRTWLSYLKVDIVKHMRTLRSSSGISLVTPIESGTFQDEAAKLFNKLPLSVRNCSNINTFSKATFNYLMDRMNNTWLCIV